MRLIPALLTGAIAATAGWYFLLRDTGPSASDVVQALHENDPTLVDADISLDDCQLTILSEHRTETEPAQIRRAKMTADLRQFRMDTVNISDPAAAPVILTITRDGTSADLLSQLEAMAAFLPEEFSATSPLEAMRGALDQPGGQFSFQVAAEVISGDDGVQTLMPHADAPLFYEFSQRVLDLPSPATYINTQLFSGSTVSKDSFILGSVVIPGKLQFRTPDQIQARALGEILFYYTAAHCPE
ncbi:hypothetical protein [Thalassobius sp. I31.1]|uniref:hypothetical protein n=1 Tax=Thalassobius sp. I31.1 TaxID=2109912 RepID=UPI000D1A25BC|nr:hypothetical protein [Thalassobius sp. I31.1]